MSQQSLLTQQVATRRVQGDTDGNINNKNAPFRKPIKACNSVAAGGSNAALAIASTPGASSLLLESIVTYYDRQSNAEFLSKHILEENGSEEWMMLDTENNSCPGALQEQGVAIVQVVFNI